MDSKIKTEEHRVEMDQIVLGSLVLKFSLPMHVVDQINEICDAAKDRRFNDSLAGKIENEYGITHLLHNQHKEMFLQMFEEYIKRRRAGKLIHWKCYLDDVWYNDMVAGEYNPPHFHESYTSDFGLSSVLMLKRPSTYGREFSKEKDPKNGYLNFISGTQDPLASSMYQVDAQVGDFFIFPYTLIHSVNPFNGTDEVRRTLSYNCNLFRYPIFDIVQQINIGGRNDMNNKAEKEK